MNATTILCILLLSLYLVLAIFWIVRSIIDTIDDRKREKRNGGRHRLRPAHVKRTCWPWNMKLPPTTYSIAVGENRSCTSMCRCPARMAFKSGSPLR